MQATLYSYETDPGLPEGQGDDDEDGSAPQDEATTYEGWKESVGEELYNGVTAVQDD